MISEQHGFLFIHYPKTGGNSIQDSLLPFADDRMVINEVHQDGIDRFDVESAKYGTRKHSTLIDYRERIPADIFGSLYKFSVIRNPFDRVISSWFSPQRVITKGIDETESIDRARFPAFVRNTKTLRHYVCLSPDRSLDADIDFLIRFESIQDDFALVCRRLGLPPLQLKLLNKAVRRDYRHYYDPEMRRLVEQRFAEELAFGKYSF